MAKALLDTVLSVASSVIVCKLLMSGDVEKNPGPGGRWIIATYHTIFSEHHLHYFFSAELDYNNVYASQILGLFS